MWLRSICRYYNSVPQFILSSATIGGAPEFVGTITGVAVSEIVETTAHPEHSRRYGSIIRGLREKEVLPRLLISYAINGMQTLCFTKSRNMAKITALRYQETMRYVSISSYRGGYRQDERWHIEKNLKKRRPCWCHQYQCPCNSASMSAALIRLSPAGFRVPCVHLSAGRQGKKALITFFANQNQLDQ